MGCMIDCCMWASTWGSERRVASCSARCSLSHAMTLLHAWFVQPTHVEGFVLPAVLVQRLMCLLQEEPLTTEIVRGRLESISNLNKGKTIQLYCDQAAAEDTLYRARAMSSSPEVCARQLHRLSSPSHRDRGCWPMNWSSSIPSAAFLGLWFGVAGRRTPTSG